MITLMEKISLIIKDMNNIPNALSCNIIGYLNPYKFKVDK